MRAMLRTLPRRPAVTATAIGLIVVLIGGLFGSDLVGPQLAHLPAAGPIEVTIAVLVVLGLGVSLRQTHSLVEKTTQLEATFENMPHGLCMFDGQYRLILCNSRYAEMYGLTSEQTRPGTSLHSILECRVAKGFGDEASREYIAQHLADAASNQPGYRISALQDGRLIEMARRPLPDGGWVGLHRDITEQKHVEASLIEKTRALEEANMRFDEALNNMSQGLCMLDASQRIVVANARHREIYELTKEQAKPGTSLRQILEYRQASGNYCGPPPGEYVTTLAKESKEIQQLGNGRVVSILRHRMPDGGWLTTHEDITDRQRDEARVAYMAHHDLLTGLANRASFMEKIEEAGARLRRRGEPFTVLMLDLDRFKNVNDTLGHHGGDLLLKEAAQRLRLSLRETDFVARLGGDEFAVIQAGEPHQVESAAGLANRIIRIIAEPYEIDGDRVEIGVSVGIALAPDDGIESGELMKRADLALYQAKSDGRNGYCFFTSGMVTSADARHQLESDLRQAISRDELELYYQPIVDAKTRKLVGAEALLRWRHPTRGFISPAEFIPLAEESGLIVPVGEWVLQRACADAANWPSHAKVAVNLSPVQFRKNRLLDVILCALAESGLPPERLELEITESILLENKVDYLVIMHQLKNLGIAFALDDFGTGYSSLSYLTMFPFDKIKIDQSFTRNLTKRADCAAIVASVMTLGAGLGITTLAEGVETEQQYNLLRLAGVNLIQGFLFGRPGPVSDLDFEGVYDERRAKDAA